MAEKLYLDEGEYLGETADGLPRGRGSLHFFDGRCFSGEIDYAAQRGSGVWRYPDGSSLRSGFTICPDAPTWVYTTAEGLSMFGSTLRFVSEGDAAERDTEADGLCAGIVELLAVSGQGIEYNARALLVDLALRRGLDSRDAVALLPSDATFLLPPHVLNAYLC